jgi:hypothetical protein
MANEKFYLIFQDQPNTRIQIDEPIQFSEVDFNLDQKENGMGRDVSLSGGSVKFRFTIERNHRLEDLLYSMHRYGFESDVKIVIVLENEQEFIGELDFATAETNDFDYFECSVIIESTLQIFKRRSETKVDMFSVKDIDGNAITPLEPINMLLQAKSTVQISEWTQPSVFTDELQATTAVISARDEFYQINPVQNLIASGIQDSYTFFTSKEHKASEFTDSFFKVITAQTSLKNVVVNISALNILLMTSASSGTASLTGFSVFSLKVYKGIDFVNSEKTTILTSTLTGADKSYSVNNQSFNISIGDIERGHSVWLWYDVKIHTPGSSSGLVSRFTLSVSLPKETKIRITTDSTAYNSITPTFRLIDLMKQVAKSISGLEVYAPRYDVGGQFYDTVLTNGKLLGGITNKPFYVSWDDIEKSINGEHNSDNEITLDGRVFVGIEDDFYTTEECGFFDNTQFSGMNKKANPIYCLNKFGLKYSKYQSLKENAEPNSELTIHGESQLTPFNKKVENSKDVSIEWVRDAILLDVQQRLSTKVKDDETATQDDDTIFAIDTVVTTNDQQFTESTKLQHTFSTTYLSLRSNGDVNFNVLGIKVGTAFNIALPDPNNGNYTVQAITNTELQLVKTSPGTISSANDGIRLTKYTYTINQATIPLTNRTNQDFAYVLNLINPDKYSNLRYSVERNIRNYWNRFLATVNLYHKTTPIRNTYYKNNGACETGYAGLNIVEKEDFIPDNPIVTPSMYEDVIFANVDFSDFLDLQTQIRTKRGFIRTIDNNRRVLKLYPIKMSYENKSRQLTLSGQEKFEPAYLTISNENGIILVNNETRLRKIRYSVEEGNKIVLFDLERQRLYNPVFWDEVSINGAKPETLEILKSWLDLLSV